MKVYLDKNFLQNISKGEQSLLISEEQRKEVERLEGMIEQDIRFCCLVTGYRGTGKSSFINYILKKYANGTKTDREIRVISYNAAKYKNYKTFIRRFIRELYFQLEKDHLASPQLKNMYLQTFFDIKKTYKNSALRLDENLKEVEKQSELEIKGNVGKIARNVFKIIAFFIPMGLIWLFGKEKINIPFWEVVWILFFIVIKRIAVKFRNSWEQKKTKKEQTQNKSEQREVAETLYDNEIAEYYIFDELEKADREKINLIFVIDELDKVEDKELDKIFHDLKPLLLSCNCNFILIAGRNMDEYLLQSQKEMDSIAKTIFTNTIYIPLSTTSEMMKLAEQFFYDISADGKTEKFYSEKEIQTYFKRKIFDAKGIKRAFINGVMADLRWEGNKPYVETSEAAEDKNKNIEPLFLVLQRMEELIWQDYTGPKRDELLQKTYVWIGKIKENRNQEFSQVTIAGEEKMISKEAIYSNVAEQMTLVNNLLDFMVEGNILERKGDLFKWKSEIVVKDIDDEDMENLGNFQRNMEYVEMFQKNWDELGNIIGRFAEYNGINNKKTKLYDPDEYEKLLGTMLPGKYSFKSDLLESLSYLQKLHRNGIEYSEINDIIKHTKTMAMQKARLIEQLIKYTIENKFEDELIITTRRRDFDIVNWNPNKGMTTFYEIKYYRESGKQIESSLIYELLYRMTSYAKDNNIKEYQLKIVVFINSIDEAEMERYNRRVRKMLSNFREKDYISVTLVPLNDYEMFSHQLDIVLQ